MSKAQAVASGQNAFVKVVHDDGQTEWIRFKTADAAGHAATAIQLGFSDRETITVSEFFDRYMEHHAIPRLRPDTVASYRRTFDSHLRASLGERPLADLDIQDVKGFIEVMRTDGSGNRRIAPMLEVLSAILGVAVKWSYLSCNPVNELDALLIGNAPK